MLLPQQTGINDHVKSWAMCLNLLPCEQAGARGDSLSAAGHASRSYSGMLIGDSTERCNAINTSGRQGARLVKIFASLPTSLRSTTPVRAPRSLYHPSSPLHLSRQIESVLPSLTPPSHAATKQPQRQASYNPGCIALRGHVLSPRRGEDWQPNTVALDHSPRAGLSEVTVVAWPRYFLMGRRRGFKGKWEFCRMMGLAAGRDDGKEIAEPKLRLPRQVARSWAIDVDHRI